MRSNPRLPILAAAFLLALLIAGMAYTGLSRDAARPEAGAARPGMTAGVFDPPHPAPEFSLPGSDGSEVNLARYRGKVVLLSFGFTHCAAVCPTTLATLAQARSGLGNAADRVQVIFVTVDPERDDAAICGNIWRLSIPASSAPPALRTRWRRCGRNMASPQSGRAPAPIMRWRTPRRSSSSIAPAGCGR
jgi:hypothetical protein